MRKYIGLLAFAFVIPLTAQAQVVCPAGYTCAPVAQVLGCPEGYVCTQVSNGNGSTSNTGSANTTTPTTPTYSQVTSVPFATKCNFDTDLTIGSSGPSVALLQNWLISAGFNIDAISSGRQTPGYFSYQTAAAVAKYQASVGILATGYFGPLTRARVNAVCNSTANTPPTIPTIPPATTNTSTSPKITRISAKASSDFEVSPGSQFAIEGTYLAGNYFYTTHVFVGGKEASLQQVTDTVLWATTPNINQGSQDLYVTNEKGTSNHVTVNVLSSGTTPVTSTTISPTQQTVASGQFAQVNFTFPSDTTKATIYTACPTGVTIGSAKGNMDCNTTADVTGSLYSSFSLINNTTSNQNVGVSYRVTTSGGIASTVIANIIVTPAGVIQPTTQPTSLKYDMPMSSPATNQTLFLNGNNAVNWTYPNDLAGKYIKLTARLVSQAQLSGGSISSNYLPGTVFSESNVNVTTVSAYNSLGAYLPLSVLSNTPAGQYAVLLTAIDQNTGVIHAGISGIFYLTGQTTTTQTPTITSVSPNSADAQTYVGITGNNLTGASAVNFYNSNGLFVGSIPPVSYSAQSLSFMMSGVFVANTPAATYQISVVTNNCPGGCESNRLPFTITSTPVTTTTSPLSASCTGGQNPSTPNTIVWGLTPTGGKSPYTYSWNMYGDVSKYGGGSATAGSWEVSYSTPGSKQAAIRITDSTGNSASATCSANISASQTTSQTPSISSISPNQGTNSTSAYIYGSNLSGALSVEFYSTDGTMVASLSGSSLSSITSSGLMVTLGGSSSINLNTPGTYQAKVLTSAGRSNALNFTITSPAQTSQALVGACSASPSGDKRLTWNGQASGGKAPYSYSWNMYGDATGYGSGSTASQNVETLYGSVGSKQAALTVRDSVGAAVYLSCIGTSSQSPTSNPTSSAGPTSSLTLSSGSISLGQVITVTSTTNSPSSSLKNAAIDLSTDNSSWQSGGVCGYWSSPSGNDSSHTITCSYTPPASGTYYMRTRGMDSVGFSDFANKTLMVTPATAQSTQSLSVSCTGTPSILGLNWNATASGGVSPYSYSWNMYGDVSAYPVGTGASQSLTVSYSSMGTKQAVVTVRDSSNQSTYNTCSGSF